MSAIYGRVTGVREMKGMQMTRIEIEIPIECFVAAINAVHNRDVLITLAPPMGGGYGVMETNAAHAPRAQEPAKPAAAVKAAAEQTAMKPHHEQTLSQWAALRCKDPQFQAWVAEEAPPWYEKQHEAGVDDEEIARNFICETCHIQSRAQLDSGGEPERMFHELIRQPFAEWANAA